MGSILNTLAKTLGYVKEKSVQNTLNGMQLKQAALEEQLDNANRYSERMRNRLIRQVYCIAEIERDEDMLRLAQRLKFDPTYQEHSFGNGGAIHTALNVTSDYFDKAACTKRLKASN